MKILVSFALTALVTLFGVAHAQSESTSGFSIVAASVGGGIAYLPRYAGSKEYRASPLLNASIQFKNGVFADALQGIGYQFKFSEKFFAIASLSMDLGRQESNSLVRPGSSYLKGMGEIKQVGLANFGMGYNFNDRSDISIVISKALGQAGYGGTAHLLGHVVVWKGANDSIDLNGEMDLGNRDYNQTYFGVTALQSRNSGFAGFSPRGGVNAFGTSVTWTHQIGQHWVTRVSAGATRYMSAVDKSPIMQKSTVFIAAASLNYNF